MRSLAVKVVSVTRGKVDIPPVAKEVHLGSPVVAAAGRVIADIDNLSFTCLQALDSGRTGELDVIVTGREEIVISITISRNERIRAPFSSYWVCEGRA